MVDKGINELGAEPVGRLLWKYSLPAVIGMLVMTTYNIIDRIFIGQGVGANAIAGLAITFPLMNISAALGTLIGVGAAARVSIVFGQKNMPLAEKILGNSLVMTIAIGVLYTLAFYLYLEPILRLFGASDATLPYAYDYMYYLLPSFILTNLCYSFNNVMRASGYPRKAMITMIIGAVVNVILDPIFIFVYDMGIRGAAIATVISMGVSAAFVMWHFIDRRNLLHFKSGIYKLDSKLIINIMAIGVSPFIVNVAGCFIGVLLNNSLYRYGGDLAIGAAGIFNTYTQMVVVITLGICQGLQPIIGYNYGAGLYNRMSKVYFLAVAVSTVIFIAGTAGAQLCPRYIALCFTSDSALIDVTCQSLRLSTLAFWMVGFPIISTALFQSVGAAGKAIFLSLTRQVLFIIPILLILPGILQLRGVWLSFPLADVCATAVTAILVYRELANIKSRVAV